MGRIIIAKGQYFFKYVSTVTSHTLAIPSTISKQGLLKYTGVIQQPYGSHPLPSEDGPKVHCGFILELEWHRQFVLNSTEEQDSDGKIQLGHSQLSMK